MGVSYLFTKQEIKAASQIRQGMKNHIWDSGEEEALERLLQKEYLMMDGDTFLLDPLMEVFLSLMDDDCRQMSFQEGELYNNQGIWLWVREDPRRLSGLILYPYPSLQAWYEEWGEGLEKEYEEIRKELEIHG